MSEEVVVKSLEAGVRRQAALYRALDYGLAGVLEGQGVTLLGFSFKTSAWDCLMTIRAVHGGDSKVCFVGSDTVPNCILKSIRDAENDLLRWKQDAFAK